MSTTLRGWMYNDDGTAASNLTVTCYDQTPTIIGTTTTDTNGLWQFTGLTDGITYDIKINNNAGIVRWIKGGELHQVSGLNLTAPITLSNTLTVSSGGINVTGNSLITGTLGGITTLTATTLAGTLSTAAQPNITSVGVLASPHFTSPVVDSGGLSVTAGGITVTGAVVVTGGLSTTQQLTVTAGGITVNAGGVTALATSTFGTANVGGGLILNTNCAAPTVAAAQLALGATTASTATAGANGAPPAQVAGYWIINVSGTNMKVPYYNV